MPGEWRFHGCRMAGHAGTAPDRNEIAFQCGMMLSLGAPASARIGGSFAMCPTVSWVLGPVHRVVVRDGV